MSNIFSMYEKALSGVKVIKSQEAFVYNPKTGKIDLPNPKYDFVGKVDLEMPNFILKMNKPNCKTAYVEDVSCLPKRLKQDLVDHFYDRNGHRNEKTKAYLIRTDKTVVKGSGRVSGSSRKSTGQSSFSGQNSVRKSATTGYGTGVEVGLDSNGRKNRGGHLMEDLVEDYLIKAGFKKNVDYYKEMYLSDVEKKWNLNLSSISNQGKAKKRFDFVIQKGETVYAIETNFYSSQGSKLNETARSYKAIALEAKDIDGFAFVWFTDGQGYLQETQRQF